MRLFKRKPVEDEVKVPDGEPVPMSEYALLYLGTGLLVTNANPDTSAQEMGVRDIRDPRMEYVMLESARSLIDLKTQLRTFQVVRPADPELFELHMTSLAKWLSFVGNLDNLFAMMQADEDGDAYYGEMYSRRSKEHERYMKIAHGDQQNALSRLKENHPDIYAEFATHLEKAHREINERAAYYSENIAEANDQLTRNNSWQINAPET